MFQFIYDWIFTSQIERNSLSMQVSAAEKKKQLNSKGEKGRGLLDVFTQPEPKEE